MNKESSQKVKVLKRSVIFIFLLYLSYCSQFDSVISFIIRQQSVIAGEKSNLSSGETVLKCVEFKSADVSLDRENKLIASAHNQTKNAAKITLKIKDTMALIVGKDATTEVKKLGGHTFLQETARGDYFIWSLQKNENYPTILYQLKAYSFFGPSGWVIAYKCS